ncbi:MAG: DNA helicase RecQ [Phycisphaerae bacterium]
MLAPNQSISTIDTRMREVIRSVWGYDTLRPLQAEAIRASLERRDSLVVMPTGGGKSLCYQVPALVEDAATVVVSPLISLMKDQVDGLREVGVKTVALHSGLTLDERRQAEREIASGGVRLIFAAPERLLNPGTIGMLQRAHVQSIAIDEAHCISHWGHDFRPEYRRLREMRDYFPMAALHAFTATATQRVRDDILRQLDLRDPQILIGSFYRPNLVFRVVPREDEYRQIREVLDRHKGEATIIYCISRKDTESVAGTLQADKYNAAAYHAGLSPDLRRRTQDRFSNETLDIVVATVAFGMGIDRSNVRCVIHAAMPKSVEHYQQEAGRAGRDGLPAECVLLYSPGDVFRWEIVLGKGTEDRPVSAESMQAASEMLGHIRGYCGSPICRHRQLSEYFGQSLDRDDCEACDVCLGEVELGEDDRVIAQKILSCVARVKERFGANHVIDVLCGANTERIRQFEHDKLSTYGLLREMNKDRVKSLINQLLDQGLLARATLDVKGMAVSVLGLNAESWRVMRNQRPVFFRKSTEEVHAAKADIDSWEGVDRELFDDLRALRKTIAEERGVPPYLVLIDTALRGLARARPTTMPGLAKVRGLGDKKINEFGVRLIECIERHVKARKLGSDNFDPPRAASPPTSATKKLSSSELRAAALFEQGASVAEVCEQMGRAQSTVNGYLEQFILKKRPKRIDHWVDEKSYEAIAMAIDKVGPGPFKTVFDELGGQYGYDLIRVVAAHRKKEG